MNKKGVSQNPGGHNERRSKDGPVTPRPKERTKINEISREMTRLNQGVLRILMQLALLLGLLHTTMRNCSTTMAAAKRDSKGGRAATWERRTSRKQIPQICYLSITALTL